METISFTVSGAEYNITRQDNPSLYDLMLEHAKMMHTTVEVFVVKQNGDCTKILLQPGNVLKQLKSAVPGDNKYYHGFLIKPTDTVISRGIRNGDYINVV